MNVAVSFSINQPLKFKIEIRKKFYRSRLEASFSAENFNIFYIL